MSPVRWQRQGRRRRRVWRLAPPTCAIPPCSCHDICWDIIKLGLEIWYTDIRGPYHMQNHAWYIIILISNAIIWNFHDISHENSARKAKNAMIFSKPMICYDIIYGMKNIIYDIITFWQCHIAQERLKLPSYMISCMIS